MVFCILIKWLELLILHKEVHLGCTCDRYKRTYSVFFRGDQYSDFLIVSAEKPFWINKYIVQNDKTFLDGTTSKVFWDFVPIPSQNSFNDFLQSPSATQNSSFKNEAL